jgi:hypothetical protein
MSPYRRILPNPLELPIWPGAALDRRSVVRMRKRTRRVPGRLRLLRRRLSRLIRPWRLLPRARRSVW